MPSRVERRARMATTGRRNNRLRFERRQRGWTQVDLVERMYKSAIDHRLPIPKALDDNYISRYERGVTEPGPHHVHLMCLAFDLPSDQLGLPGDSAPHAGTMGEGRDDTERRDFLRQGARAAFALFAGDTADWLSKQLESPRPIVDPLTILDYRTLGGAHGEQQTLTMLRTAVAEAKRAYQSCRHADLAASLPQLLANLNAAAEAWSGEDRLAAYALSAEAHHVAASLLLKHEDHGPAWVVADRSMHAAVRSGEPLIVASSARILTHVFMSTGHLAAAATTATKESQEFSSTWNDPTADDLSIYGSLLLRGAIAAAREGNRGSAYELLDEADEAARRLGKDDNRRWTAFGPTNVRLHQVHVAVRLGDAGTAIELARKIDLDSLAVIERKASLLVDAATALTQSGRVEQSYRTIRAAEALAPEEMAARPAVRQLVVDLLVRAPRHLVPELRQLAARVGATGPFE